MISKPNSKPLIIYDQLLALILNNLKKDFLQYLYIYRKNNTLNYYNNINDNSQHKTFIPIFINCDIIIYDLIKYKISPCQSYKLAPYLLFNILYKSLCANISHQNLLHVNSTHYWSNFYQIEHYAFKKYIFFEILLFNISLLINCKNCDYKTNPVPQITLYYFSSQIILHDLILNLSSLLKEILLLISPIIISNYKNASLNLNQYVIDLSQRYTTNIKNNILLNYYIDYYLVEPKKIYENYYLLKTIQLDKIYCKNINLLRNYETSLLLISQIIITYLLEIQDFIIPKIQYITYIICIIPFINLYRLFKNKILPRFQHIFLITKFTK